MIKILKFAVEIINEFHDMLTKFFNGFGMQFNDKQLHFIIIGVIGMVIYLVVDNIFKVISKYSISALSFIYTATVLVVIVFGIEIEQKITNRGNMEFADIMAGLWGFAAYIAAILCMAIIFKLSSQPAVQSSKLSTGITKINIKVIEEVKPNIKLNIVKFDHMVRKNAHFFIYLVLGLFVINALRRSGVRGYRCVVFSLLICILYAISDELHQVFVPGRGA